MVWFLKHQQSFNARSGEERPPAKRTPANPRSVSVWHILPDGLVRIRSAGVVRSPSEKTSQDRRRPPLPTPNMLATNIWPSKVLAVIIAPNRRRPRCGRHSEKSVLTMTEGMDVGKKCPSRFASEGGGPLAARRTK